MVNLGQKTLQNKVYNVTKTAVDDHAAPARPAKPTLSRNDGLDANELTLKNPGTYSIYGTLNEDVRDADINMSISGNSTGYCFYLDSGGTVTLDGNGTANFNNDIFIWATNGNLTIILNTDYTINCKNYVYGIGTDYNLMLGVTSETKRLTITVSSTAFKGLYGGLNYDYTQYAIDLATYDCTVALESETDNHDGTYTYVYAVTKI